LAGAIYDYDSDDEGDGRTVVGSEQYKIIKDLPWTTGTNSVSYGEPVAAFVELRIENHDVADE
jgi:hypothetical protein